MSLFIIITVPAITNAQGLRKVNVTISALTESSITFFVAREKGYWRDEGLDVELILARAAPSIHAFIAGNVEFGTAGGSALLPISRELTMTFREGSLIRSRATGLYLEEARLFSGEAYVD